MAKLIAPVTSSHVTAPTVTALGQVADKLGQGKQVFIGLNYGAQRVKKQAFEEQAIEQVRLRET